MNKEEKDDNYWKGYIQKQKEAEEICKMCKYRKTYKELKQKQSILDKVTKTLKRDREIFDKCRKKHEMYSPSEERMNTKYHYTEKLLNIIEGEKNNGRLL